MSAFEFTQRALMITMVVVVASFMSSTTAGAAFVPTSTKYQLKSAPFFHYRNTHQDYSTFKTSVEVSSATTATATATSSILSATNRDGFYDSDKDDVKMKPEDVHVILFNPNTEREGVHTIEYPKDSGNNTILAFESKVECERFSINLKEQNFYNPVPKEMNLDSLEEYCATIGVKVEVVPIGADLKPPTDNASDLGYNPDLEKEMDLLDYLFAISKSDDSGMDMDDESVSQDGVIRNNVDADDFGGGAGAWE